MTDAPQLYLILPPAPDVEALARAMGEIEVACLRVAPGEGDVARVADAVRVAAHASDVAVVIEDRVEAVASLGLDGVHLTNGAKGVAFARKTLGDDAIVGAGCGASRDEGITAGERGADYVSFDAGAPHDLFAWWSEMIELPVVAEGPGSADDVERLAEIADWIALGPDLWDAPDPSEALRALTRALRAAPA